MTNFNLHSQQPPSLYLPTRSKKYSAWSRLIERFHLIQSDSFEGAVGSIVQPVTDADALLRTPEASGGWLVSSVSSTGYQTALTVPDGKRYTLLAGLIQRNSGDGTVTIAGLLAPAGVPTYPGSSVSTVPIKTQTGAADLSLLPTDIPGGILVDQGWKLQFYVNAVTMASEWNVRMYFLREDAY